MRGSRASAVLCLVLAAFVLQTVATRSHFHLGSATLTIAKLDMSETAGKPLKAPLGHDESNCPLWHAAGICTAAVAASAFVLFVPQFDQARTPVDQRAIHFERFAAHWRSRAPPTL